MVLENAENKEKNIYCRYKIPGQVELFHQWLYSHSMKTVNVHSPTNN